MTGFPATVVLLSFVLLIYGLDFSGAESESSPKQVWCVARNGSNPKALMSALNYACGQGNETCDPIQPGKVCYRQDSFISRVNYAFSAYWAEFKKLGGTCDFNGLAQQTTNDPSYASCKFPSVTL